MTFLYGKHAPAHPSAVKPPSRVAMAPRVSSPAALIPAKPFTVEIPIVTVSEANQHSHWRVRQRRAQHQHASVGGYLMANRCKLPPFPVVVTMTRLSRRKLDSDNAVGSMKHVRDAIAKVYGVDDGDERWTWNVEQEAARDYGVRISLAAASAGGGQP